MFKYIIGVLAILAIALIAYLAISKAQIQGELGDVQSQLQAYRQANLSCKADVENVNAKIQEMQQEEDAQQKKAEADLQNAQKQANELTDKAKQLESVQGSSCADLDKLVGKFYGF